MPAPGGEIGGRFLKGALLEKRAQRFYMIYYVSGAV
jgi:hypothetical protein